MPLESAFTQTMTRHQAPGHLTRLPWAAVQGAGIGEAAPRFQPSAAVPRRMKTSALFHTSSCTPLICILTPGCSDSKLFDCTQELQCFVETFFFMMLPILLVCNHLKLHLACVSGPVRNRHGMQGAEATNPRSLGVPGYRLVEVAGCCRGVEVQSGACGGPHLGDVLPI